MKLDLQSIPRLKGISKEDFLKEFFVPQKPVVMEDLTADWSAREKWNLEYFREEVGEIVVPIYDGKPAKGHQSSHGPVMKIKMKEYIDILKKGPTD